VQSHLIRRGGIYYYRRRIPADLLAHFNPSGKIAKREFVKSLGTADRREAERLVRAFAAEHDNQFETIRNQIGMAPDGAAVGNAPSLPVNNGQIPGASGQLPAIGDVQLVATRVLTRLRAQREQAVSDGTLSRFIDDQRQALDWDRHALEGKGDVHFPVWKLEAFIIAR
jgi:hypothetical protein